jgi:hypothetical protein
MIGRIAWRLAWRGPGTWLLLASFCGWTWLALPALPESLAMAHHHHHGHTQHAGLTAWLAMLLAMAPLVLRSEIAFLWRTNLPRQRWPAILTFLVFYGLPWLALGSAWAWLLGGMPWTRSALLLGLLGLATWRCSPLRQRCLNRCHGLPRLRAFGPGLVSDTARFGWRTGALCCAICGPAMVWAMGLPDYHLAAMLAITVIATIERYLPTRRPAWRPPSLISGAEPHWRSLVVPPASPAKTA